MAMEPDGDYSYGKKSFLMAAPPPSDSDVDGDEDADGDAERMYHTNPQDDEQHPTPQSIYDNNTATHVVPTDDSVPPSDEEMDEMEIEVPPVDMTEVSATTEREDERMMISESNLGSVTTTPPNQKSSGFMNGTPATASLSPTPIEEDYTYVTGDDEEMMSVQGSEGEFSHDAFDFSSDKDKTEENQDGESVGPPTIARPFNMQLLRRSIEDGSAILDHLDRKEVVLVVGKTGTGKSTLIQALAGKEIITVQHKIHHHESGEMLDKTVFEAQNALEGFAIGHAKTSETRHVNFYSQQVVSKKDGSVKELVFLDSPGFEDTAGHEVDIATSVMLSQVARRCSRLRFVILINYLSLLEDRGGAMKGILKLVRAFVEDFEASKMAFLFMFTHTNEIAFIPQDSLEDARECLRKEIMWTIDGTRDEDVLQVLGFMRKCLKEGYPLVDIFHPVMSDIGKVKTTIQRLKPVTGEYLASHCGLTQTSKLKLTGELNRHFQDVASIFESDSPDIHKSLDILETFELLKSTIDVNEVQEKADIVRKMFRGFIAHHRSLIHDELALGTSWDHDFGPANVIHLRRSCGYLQELEEDFPEDIAINEISERLVSGLEFFVRSIKEESQKEFTSVHRHLSKLQAWSQGFPQFARYYEETREYIFKLIHDVCSFVETFEKRSQLESAPEDWIRDILRNMSYLESVVSFADGLSPHFDITRASKTFTTAESDFWMALESWKVDNQDDIKTAARAGEGIEPVINRARAVERIHACLENPAIFPGLQEQAKATRQNLLEAASLFMNEASSKAQEIKPEKVLEVKKWLNFLSSTNQAYLTVPHPSWNEILSPFRSLISSYISLLQNKSGELESLTKMAATHGVEDGRRDYEAMAFFTGYKFLDKLLPTREQFVETCSTAYSRAYKKRSNDIAKSVDTCTNRLNTREGNPLDLLHSLKTLIREQREISYLSPLLADDGVVPHWEHPWRFQQAGGDPASAPKKTEAKIAKYIEGLGARTNGCSKKWLAAIEEGKETVSGLTEELCMSVREVEVLSELDLEFRNSLSSIKAEVEKAMERFSKGFNSVIRADQAYEEKANLLLAMSRIVDASGNSKTLPVPDFTWAKDEVRRAIRIHAEKIEKQLRESSDWDGLEARLGELKKAKLLDEYTSSEGSTRLRSLRTLLDQKQDAVDDLVEKLIETHDYKGLRDFLVPSANSKDQVRKHKFEICLNRIASSLSSVAQNIENILRFSNPLEADIKVIGEDIRALQRANADIGEYLESAKGSISLDTAIHDSRSHINKRASDCFTKMNRAASELDFVTLGVNKALADALEKHLSDFFTEATKKRHAEAMSGFTKAVDSVPAEIEEYFHKLFRNDKLLPLLSSLKASSQLTSPELLEFVALYEYAKADLLRYLRSLMKEFREHVQVTKSFDEVIKYLGDLDEHLRRGLEDHISSKEVLDDIRNQRTAWANERLQTERNLVEKRVTEHVILEWKSLLDSVDPSTWEGRARRWVTGDTSSYRTWCKIASAHAKKQFGKGEAAVRSRDFTVVQECIEILRMMECHLSNHVPFVRGKSDKLKAETFKLFVEFCEQANEALQSDSRRQEFQNIFESYRKLVIAVPSVVSAIDDGRGFRLTNQRVYETLCKDIAQLEEWTKTFDFPSLKIKIERVRAFGEYVADFATILHEEMKACVDLVEDEWLLKTLQLCQQHFSCGRDFSRLNLFALVGAPPSATQQDVKKAFKAKAKLTHPDKQGAAAQGDDKGDLFRQIKQAHDTLLKIVPEKKTETQSFDYLIKDVRVVLRKKINELLDQQSHADVEKILFHLGDLHLLDNLVSPPLKSSATIAEIMSLVKRHVGKIQVDIDSNWAERKYQTLNSNIAELKLMEDKFKSYPDILSGSWYSAIVKRIEQEIIALAQKARSHLINQATAKSGLQDFRRCFIDMGKVLVELAPFKQFTKARMSEVLEACLTNDWGYSYLFDFGLGLQRHDENCTEEENLVAQMILSEFNHFKEVLTMVWNEETSTKPVEDTVHDIRGHLRMSGVEKHVQVDTGLLLKSFYDFEGDYKSLLGDFLHPDADLSALIQKILIMADDLKPCTCDTNWGGKTKLAIPKILAGVFAVFTILKSGESYKRMGSATGKGDISEKILMKPHNIQVLTLLCMFGCSSPTADSLESQLMQIRTGEGKSIILGAAAVVLGLLGFRVRCVCYSEYLSTRDYALFSEVFEAFELTELVKYSKITTLSEDTTAAKGDIRLLTERLLRGHLGMEEPRPPGPTRASAHNAIESAPVNAATLISSVVVHEGIDEAAPSFGGTGGKQLVPRASWKAAWRQPHKPGRTWPREGTTERSEQVTVYRPQNQMNTPTEEILLVDEVDVFFGSEFYGHTYNQVAQVQDREIEVILEQIWQNEKAGGRRLRLCDIQASQAYKALIRKFPGFEFLVDSEIGAMLNEVRLVDEEPYYVDQKLGRIGYKVMDSISYEATYGYRTVFAYMKEVEKGELTRKDLSKVMAMQVSCGRFSYANISPARVLGVSGTLEAMGEYEKNVLAKYGLKKFLFVPSVYGGSNFVFDPAGEGVRIEKNKSDFFHSITDQILQETKKKRAVIAFFQNKDTMDEYTKSAFYRKLGRQKMLLKEDMPASDKEFVISKAATSSQITISTAVFGRGTDFVCQDQGVQQSGGVHVIQTFLSEEVSEEIQIQGRTARQGKKGSYQLILLETDLAEKFGMHAGNTKSVAKKDLYASLCVARDKRHQQRCRTIENNLSEATATDKETHAYFDALIARDYKRSGRLFSELYKSFKKKQMPSDMSIDIAFAVDQTGSMAPYTRSTKDTLKGIINGPQSIIKKLQNQFPEITFRIRVAVMGYRDVDDKGRQFQENVWGRAEHFTDNLGAAIQAIDKTLANPLGGGDIAEDHLGAIQLCTKWQSPSDWSSDVKFMMLLTDAPAHSMVPRAYTGAPNADKHSLLHPRGLTSKAVVTDLIERDIDLFFCSFNPVATSATEAELSKELLNNPKNSARREVVPIPMVNPEKNQAGNALTGGYGKHIVFVLDESGSMQNDWAAVVNAYNEYLNKRKEKQCWSDLVSVVQFDDEVRTTVQMKALLDAATTLDYAGGLTYFNPAAKSAKDLVETTPSTHQPVVVFMSDGAADDASAAASTFSRLNSYVRKTFPDNLELHVIAFGDGASTTQLQQIAKASPRGRVYTSGDAADLSGIFVNIAGGQDLSRVLQAEVGKRISEAVADRLAIEYLG